MKNVLFIVSLIFFCGLSLVNCKINPYISCYFPVFDDATKSIDKVGIIFGYSSDEFYQKVIPLSKSNNPTKSNYILPAHIDGTQTIIFNEGDHPNAFYHYINEKESITWNLLGETAYTYFNFIEQKRMVTNSIHSLSLNGTELSLCHNKTPTIPCLKSIQNYCENNNYCDGKGVCETNGICNMQSKNPCSSKNLLCIESKKTCGECIDTNDCLKHNNFCTGKESYCDVINNKCLFISESIIGEPYCATQGKLCSSILNKCVECKSSEDCTRNDISLCQSPSSCHIKTGLCIKGPIKCKNTEICNHLDGTCSISPDILNSEKYDSSLNVSLCSKDLDCFNPKLKETFCEKQSICSLYSNKCIKKESVCSNNKTYPFCNNKKQKCDQCLIDEDCDDFNYCNGKETCNRGKCQKSKKERCTHEDYYCDENNDRCCLKKYGDKCVDSNENEKIIKNPDNANKDNNDNDLITNASSTTTQSSTTLAIAVIVIIAVILLIGAIAIFVSLAYKRREIKPSV